MTTKKIYYFVLGIVLTAIARVVWSWQKTGFIGKSFSIVLSLVFLIFALASFYVAAPESITRAADVDVSVSASTDDGFCYEGGTCYLTGNNARAGTRSGFGDCHAGFRFLNIAIPQGATIDSAYFTYIAQDTDASNDYVKVWAEAADDGVTFTTSGVNSPEGKTAGSVSVAWTLPHQVATNSYTSPDIKTVIQEVVDRVGWSSGNALVILIKDNSSSNNHNMGTIDTVNQAASIAINYTEDGGPARRIIIVE